MRKKQGLFKKKIRADQFTDSEKRLIAITRSLAGAVKAVIDTPILDKGSNITSECNETYEKTVAALPSFNKQYSEVKSTKYKGKPVYLVSYEDDTYSYVEPESTKRNVLALALGIISGLVMLFLIPVYYNLFAIPAFAVITLLVSDINTENKFFKFIRNACKVIIVLANAILQFFAITCIAPKLHWLAVLLIPIVIAFVCLIIGYFLSKRKNSVTNTLETIIIAFGFEMIEVPILCLVMKDWFMFFVLFALFCFITSFFVLNWQAKQK